MNKRRVVSQGPSGCTILIVAIMVVYFILAAVGIHLAIGFW